MGGEGVVARWVMVCAIFAAGPVWGGITDPLNEAEIQRLATEFKHSQRALDWDQLARQPGRVFLFGEYHGIRALHRELIRGMKVLKAHGFTHLGMEFLREDDTEVVEGFEGRRVDDDLLLQRFRRRPWWCPESYLEVARAARDLGIKLVALDETTEEFDEDPSDRRHVRNRRMVANIQRVLDAQANARMFVLAGENHVRATAIPRYLDRTLGVMSFAFLAREDFLKAIEAAQISRPSYITLSTRERQVRGLDAYLYLPEIPRELQRARADSVPG